MNDFVEIRTVLGKKKVDKNTVTLAHEHICCYSAYLDGMSDNYINKSETVKVASEFLKQMKEKYGLGVFIDCTPLNIGRNIEILKTVSENSGVNIVCSSGLYYNEDPILNCMSAEALADFIVEDTNNACAGIIKAAVEYKTVSEFNVKLLKATAVAQKKTGLPIVLHTNANNKNGAKAVEILLDCNVAPERIVVGHLSDTDDIEYIKSIAKNGCYIALDRIYDDKTEKYLASKAKQIIGLCDAGYENQILLSHDDAVFQGFCANPKIKAPRWNFMFEYLLPLLDSKTAKKISAENPLMMLCAE